ncbi:MAG: aminopeptidase P family protein [Actinomycetota bacterium]
MDRNERLRRVRSAMVGVGCDALVVTKAVNIRWLTGFTGSAGLIVIGPDRLALVTDQRYQTQVREQLAAASVEAEVAITREPEAPVVAAVAGADSVGLESEHVTWAEVRRFERWLDGRALIATEQLVETERRVKDAGEIDRLRAAAAIADAALAEVIGELGTGLTEAEVATRLDRAMVDGGADGPSFPTIVAAGPNSAKPHARPSDRVIADGDMVVIDFGASVDGYGSDMTRSFLIGAADARQREIYEAVADAQAAGVAAVADGVAEREIDRACRDRLADHGLAEAFIHGTGHGIGLEIHENPILSTRATGILRTGYVVTVEPGAYLPDLGGIRVEDSVVVTDSGCETLTHSPKDPNVACR